MIKGEKIRLEIHKILFSIYKFNKTLNDSLIKKKIERQKKEDIAFLYNVTLNSMRFHLHCIKIINIYIKKKLRDQEKILLISAITQIVFLDFKEYAVINCSVEISKKLKLYSGLINATLKKIALNKKKLSKTKLEFNDMPLWLQKQSVSLSNDEKKKFIDNFFKEPDIHIVFKDEAKLNLFEDKLIRTSKVSGFLSIRKNVRKINSFVKGNWWVQDFSSFFPLYNFAMKDKNKKYLDACAAPGGKSFQLLSKNLNVVLNDKNKTRIETLQSNLDRLKFNVQIINSDFIEYKKRENYDVIIIDAPCSSIGTIRKNPEILFKSKEPNFDELVSIQQKMLVKASDLVNKNGFIIYMTCSFLKIETKDQIDKFLKENNNFLLSNFRLIKDNINYSKLIKNNFMTTLPDRIFNKNIDGYFAAYLKKIK